MMVLIPLPDEGFDPTETAVPWNALVGAGHTVVFATPSGRAAAADDRTLTGRGLGPLRGLLQARPHARELYSEMQADPAFADPFAYDDLDPPAYDAVLLPGGHAPGMRPYLEAIPVRECVEHAMREDRPVAAICHGVLAVSRAVDPDTGRSVLHGRRTTALLRSQELAAWASTRAWLGSHYRTYPESVEDEVKRALASPDDFVPGPLQVLRERPDWPDHGFTVRDGNYLSARFYGDTYRFAGDFLALLSERDTRAEPRARRASPARMREPGR